MTRIQTLIILPFALLLGACDREDTDNAEPNDEAVAQSDDDERGGGRRGGLKRLDTDKDGFISQAEAKDHRIADKFAELDADKDGKLSREELHAMKGHRGKGEGHDKGRGKGHGWHGDKDPAERAAHFMSKFDADKDGAISQAELAEHPKLAGKFAELDANKDGKLVSAELAAMKGHGKKDPAERAAHMLEKFDADKDGALSQAELAEHPKFAGKFAEVDSDKNGKLSREELTAFKAAHHGPRGDRGRGPEGGQKGEAHL